MKRCLVTGGTGFIGVNLIQELLAAGHHVDLLVHPAHNPWRLHDILPHVQLHVAASSDLEALRACLTKSKPDWIFNLAAHGAYSWQNNDALMVETNLTHTINLLQLFTELGFEAFVQAGSSSEYGFKNHPPAEDEIPEPNSIYAITKNAATNTCQWLGKSRKLPICILRLYSIYGPYEDTRRLIPQLILKGLESKFPPLAYPEIVRDFVYVSDAVSAFIKAAQRADEYPGEIFNVGSGKQTSLAQTVKIAREYLQLHENPVWETMPNRSWDTSSWVANANKIQIALDWNTTVELTEGFSKTVKWFKSRTMGSIGSC